MVGRSSCVTVAVCKRGFIKMKVRRQHYVWKNYLTPWTTNGRIWCRHDKNIFLTDPVNIGQERDFYRLNELDEAETKTLIDFIGTDSLPHLQKLNRKWLELFNGVFQLRRVLGRLGTIPDEANARIEEYVNNFEELIHGKLENKATVYLNSLLKEDVGFFNTEQGYIGFMWYLCVQYVRTKRMKAHVIRQVPQIQSVKTERIWNVMSHMFATNMGWGFFAERNSYRMCLLKNSTLKGLITGDQPVINTFATGPENAPPKDVEFYYPISPKLAVLITKSRPDCLGKYAMADTDVAKYNSMISEQSYLQLYAATKGDFFDV